MPDSATFQLLRGKNTLKAYTLNRRSRTPINRIAR
jgi:hypothetical protein